MAHVRSQIRDAVATRLTGLVTTGSKVFRSQNFPNQPGLIPSLIIYTRSDVASYDDEAASMGPPTPARTIDLRVKGYARGAATTLDTPDDQMDTIAAEVETAMFTDHTFGGLAIETQLGDTEITVDGEGDQAHGVIDIGFNVTYRTVEGAPETAV